MKSQSNIYVQLNDGNPIISNNNLINNSLSMLLSFCLNCQKWYCTSCEEMHFDSNNHQQFVIVSDSNYSNGIKPFISFFCVQLCLHHIKEFNLPKVENKINIENKEKLCREIKRFIEEDYDQLYKVTIRKLKKWRDSIDKYNKIFTQFINQRLSKHKFLSDLYYIFTFIFEEYFKNKESLYQEL